jgi:hypothetical protein
MFFLTWKQEDIFLFKIFELSVYVKMNLFLSTNIYEIKMYLQ